MRLNGWQRLGVVLAIAWLPIGFFWGNSIAMHQGDWAVSLLKLCESGPSQQDSWNHCETAFEANWKAAMAYHWWYVAIVVFLPFPLLLIVWGVVRGLKRVVRWVYAGFASTDA